LVHIRLGYRHAPSIPLTFNDAQRAETDFFHGEPLRALSTLVYSENVDLQRSASLTFAEITERGTYHRLDDDDAVADLSPYL
jgi:hypothetical protein